ncbi:MAG TPA: cytochrome c oxidase assembly protein [Burkholderiales bacterium]|jgi:cytochrome c oxidase assembly protein subunit 11|nr:cytochrome c oxidase assembly protein [Burkholderiales bacterium]
MNLWQTKQANRQMFTRLSVFALLMFGFGFAMVPFYQKLCQVTGLTDLLQPNAAVANTQIDTSRWVTLELDANTHGMPWQFAPMQRSVRVHPGEITQVEFAIKNNGSSAMVGQAIPSYGPKHVAAFVKKLECFCFKQQVLAAGESRQMPVQFVIDPALPADINTFTLSYTFFEVNGANVKKTSAATAATGKAG